MDLTLVGLRLDDGSPPGGWVSPWRVGLPLEGGSPLDGSPLEGLSGCPAEKWTSSRADLRSPAWKGLSLGLEGAPASHAQTPTLTQEGKEIQGAKCSLCDFSRKTFFGNKQFQWAQPTPSHTTNSGVGTEALGFLRLQAPSTRGRHFVVHPNLTITFVGTIKCCTWPQPAVTFF